MVAILRRLVLGAFMALLAAGAAAAQDYIVVGSTDPAFTRGQSVEGGVRVKLAPGRKLTLMHASGDVITLRGAAGGVVAPERGAGRGDAERLAVLKMIVAPGERSAAGMRAARTRAGVRPAPSGLTTLDAIVQVHQAGCAAAAAEALAAWLAAHPPLDA